MSSPEAFETPAPGPAGGSPEVSPVLYFEHCPICGHRLVGRTCKLFCSNDECHYYQSCSDIV